MKRTETTCKPFPDIHDTLDNATPMVSETRSIGIVFRRDMRLLGSHCPPYPFFQAMGVAYGDDVGV